MADRTAEEIKALDQINGQAAGELQDLNDRYFRNPAMPRNAETRAAYGAELKAIEDRRAAARQAIVR